MEIDQWTEENSSTCNALLNQALKTDNWYKTAFYEGNNLNPNWAILRNLCSPIDSVNENCINRQISIATGTLWSFIDTENLQFSILIFKPPLFEIKTYFYNDSNNQFAAHSSLSLAGTCLNFGDNRIMGLSGNIIKFWTLSKDGTSLTDEKGLVYKKKLTHNSLICA